MNEIDIVRLTFTCAHCGSTNELTATHVHLGTVIHCSRCSVSIAPLSELSQKRPTAVHRELALA